MRKWTTEITELYENYKKEYLKSKSLIVMPTTLEITVVPSFGLEILSITGSIIWCGYQKAYGHLVVDVRTKDNSSR